MCFLNGEPRSLLRRSPYTTEHHIRWIQLFFKPEGDKFSYQIGIFEFTAHGESVDGPDKGPVYTNHSVTTTMKTKKPGTLYATSLCNIHGLWENSKLLKVKQGGEDFGKQNGLLKDSSFGSPAV